MKSSSAQIWKKIEPAKINLAVKLYLECWNVSLILLHSIGATLIRAFMKFEFSETQASLLCRSWSLNTY